MAGKWWLENLNLVYGCTPISPGCDNCYAADTLRRFPGKAGRFEGLVTTHAIDTATGPLVVPCYNGEISLNPNVTSVVKTWKKPRVVFPCNVSDVFHRNVPTDIIFNLWACMSDNPKHVFTVLTKRTERMAKIACAVYDKVKHDADRKLKAFPRNIYWGTTVENQECLDRRVIHLNCVPGNIWVCCEPLLGPLRFSQTNIGRLSWVVAGAETGPGARPCNPDWLRSLRDQCRAANVPLWLKATPEGDGLLDGIQYREVPRDGHPAWAEMLKRNSKEVFNE